jgi:predicted nicotinamide N-methyase
MALEAMFSPGTAGLDSLRLSRVPLVPEIRLFVAEDATVLWARLEAEAGQQLPPPFWASAWAGGQALARYVLDHPEVVAGRTVLDLASGSGLVAIAAAMAGAAATTANDVDPYAIAAISANAEANGVAVDVLPGDLLDGDGGGADVVLAGDVLYNRSLAGRVLPFLHRLVERGAYVLVGDPDRGHVPHYWLKAVANYRLLAGSAEDAQIERTNVLAPWHRPPGTANSPNAMAFLDPTPSARGENKGVAATDARSCHDGNAGRRSQRRLQQALDNQAGLRRSGCGCLP